MFNFEDGELETKNISGVEIFAVGTHNGKEFDESDLDQIVESYRSVKSEIEAPIKAGHSNQLAINDGMPALGWVDQVYKDAKKVKADFKNVPKKVAQMIKSRAFKKVSIELLPSFTDSDGNEHEKVLSGVALLGADTPAVKTLDDIPKLFDNSEQEEVLTYSMEIEETNENDNPENDNPSEGDNPEEMSESEFSDILEELDMDKEEFKKKFSDLTDGSTSEGGNSVDEEEVEELKQERDEFKERVDELEDEKEELTEKYSDLQEKVLEYKLDSACQELALAEEKEEKFRDFVTAQVEEFSDERAEEVIDDAKDLIGTVSEQPDTQEYTAETGAPESGEEDVDSQVESILNA